VCCYFSAAYCSEADGGRERPARTAPHTQYYARCIMPLIQLLVVLIVIGVLLWLVNSFIPMQRSIKKILNAVVVIAVVLWLLNVFGLLTSLSTLRVG
jgi:hypothetical protein